jgi:uncharacterized protein (TIGR03000 family)
MYSVVLLVAVSSSPEALECRHHHHHRHHFSGGGGCCGDSCCAPSNCCGVAATDGSGAGDTPAPPNTPNAAEAKAWTEFAAKVGKVKDPPTKAQLKEWADYYNSDIDSAERKSFLDDLKTKWLSGGSGGDKGSWNYTKPATIVVRVPENVEILFDGTKTNSTGERRVFVTPGLGIGHSYEYTLTAATLVDGKKVTKNFGVDVMPGQKAVVVVDFKAEMASAK